MRAGKATTMDTSTTPTAIRTDGALLRLIWLASPALPVGGFSYSEGLEAAVEAGLVADEASAADWLADQLHLALAQSDLAVVAQAVEAFRANDTARVAGLDRWVRRTRETSELRLQSEQMGRSLGDWSRSLEPQQQPDKRESLTYPVAFARAAAPVPAPVRDIVLAAVLGAGAIMDAFSVALRLPNHFRAIFGEGAVNQAYVPTYALIAEKEGREAANLFADRLFTIQLIVQIVLLAIALPLMPWLVTVLAPGFTNDPAVFELAVALTRITFPYLLFVTMVTFLGATLNAVERYAAFAAAPILLNIFIVAALAVPFLFPSAAHAAAWGVALSGLAQWALLYVAARRAGVSGKVVRPRMDAGVRHFLKVFGPAVIGSAGVQIAIFTDGIIASMLPRGGYAALYYAERLYQLPLGLIAIAVGTDHLFELMCGAMGLTHLPEDTRFATNVDRCANHTDLKTAMEDVLRTDTGEAWRGRLIEAGVPVGIVLNVDDTRKLDQIAVRGMIKNVGGFDVPGTPLKFGTWDSLGATIPSPELDDCGDMLRTEFAPRPDA